MNNVIKGNWKELKGNIRQAWAKLTDDDIALVKGNWEELSGRIEKAYGYKKEKAIEEIESFKKRFLNKVDPPTATEFKTKTKATH